MSAESKAFTNKYAELVVCIQNVVMDLSDKCLGKNLISREVHDEIMQTDIKGNKARLLLKSISDRIQERKDTYKDFIAILEEDPYCDEAAKSLSCELQDVENRANISQVTIDTHTTDAHTTDAHCSIELSTAKKVMSTAHSLKGSSKEIASSIEEVQISSSSEYVCKQSHDPQNIASNTTDSTDSCGNHIDTALIGIKEVLGNLQNAKLDNHQKSAQLLSMQDEIGRLKEEHAKIKKEKNEYFNTIENLNRLIKSKEDILSEKSKELDNTKIKLARSEKEKDHEIRRRKQSEEQNISLNSSFICTANEKRELEAQLKEAEELYHARERKLEELDDVLTEYEQVCEKEQFLSREVYSMSQEKSKRRSKLYRYAFCIIAVIVMAFAVLIITFAYCLEDQENNNIRKCISLFMTILEKYF